MKRLFSPFFLVFLAVLFFQCKPKPKTDWKEVDAAFAAYVKAFSSGFQSRNSPIVVQFHNAPPLAAEVEDLNSLWHFSPSISGKSVWRNPQTLVWQPDEPLPSGTRYDVKLDLKSLMEVKPGYEELHFQMETWAMNADLGHGSLESYRQDDYTWNMYRGQLETADWVGNEELEKAFEVLFEGNKLSLSWSHAANGRVHRYSIDSVERRKELGWLDFRLDGKALGMDEDLVQRERIPSIYDFYVTHTEIQAGKDAGVNVYFSDPLNETQDLEGKVMFSDGLPLSFSVYKNRLDIRATRKTSGDVQLEITESVTNSMGNSLKEAYRELLHFEDQEPALRQVSKGFVLPEKGPVYFPFEAINLKEVDLRIYQIRESNVHQYFQVNKMGGGEELNRVARQVAQKRIRLPFKNKTQLRQWQRYHIDLRPFVKSDPGALYLVGLAFTWDMTVMSCWEGDKESPADMQEIPTPEFTEWDEEYKAFRTWGYTSGLFDDIKAYQHRDYSWKERDNPCNPAYYTRDKFIEQPLLVSNLGISAHQAGNRKWLFVTTNLINGQPLSGVKVKLFSFQKDLLFEKTSNADGFLEWAGTSEQRPFLVEAESGGHKAFLRLVGEDEVDMSHFPVDGYKTEAGGTKLFLYTERGVRRPGDSLYLGCMVQDRNSYLPIGMPVVLEVTGPDGQLLDRRLKPLPKSGHLMFRWATNLEAPTGYYQARVTVGPIQGSKSLLVETIKPNRLAIETETPPYIDSEGAIGLKAKWLHGADADRLLADVLLTLEPDYNPFPQWKGFHFPVVEYSDLPGEMEVFQGKLSSTGFTRIPMEMAHSMPREPMLASLQIKVFEPSGNFSIDQVRLPWLGKERYPGLKVPEAAFAWEGLVPGKPYSIKIVLVNRKGKAASGKVRIEVALLEDIWWWDIQSRGDGSYRHRRVHRPIIQKDLLLKAQANSFPLTFPKNARGAFEIKLTDRETGLSTRKWVYVRGNQDEEASEEHNAVALLGIKPSKSTYQTGETLTLDFKAGHAASALVLVENNQGLLHSQWINPKRPSDFRYLLDSKASPNVFVSVWAFMPHAKTLGGKPPRLIGMTNVQVQFPGAELRPMLACPDEVRPAAAFSVAVSEATGKPMSYCLAVVDEGLLGLTRFKTPNPFAHFYAPEAFGGKKWDMYDQVMGAFSIDNSKALLTGGDAALDPQATARARRFEPVVQVLGPFELPAGQSAKHHLKLPNYMGKVRVMAVASDGQEAYGSAEKFVQVSQPLMALGTLPRGLRTGEVTRVPVTVFVGKPGFPKVNARIRTKGPVAVVGASSQTLHFEKPGEQTVFFELKAGSAEGSANIQVDVQAGKETAKWTSALPISFVNPVSRISNGYVLQPGETITLLPKFAGIPNTRNFTLEASCAPPLDLENHLDYLLEYPYGCTEQISSKLLVQMALPQLISLSNVEKTHLKQSVQTGLYALALRQVSSGAMRYWSGGTEISDWSAFYAGLAMWTARQKGYENQPQVLDRLLKYLAVKTQQFRVSNLNREAPLVQAQLLYLLSMTGNPQRSAMNYLRDRGFEDAGALLYLSAAYAQAGQQEDAMHLLLRASKTRTHFWQVNDLDFTAITLGILSKNKDKQQRANQLLKLSKMLSQGAWYPTFSRAIALHVAAENIRFSSSELPVFQVTQSGSTLQISGETFLARHSVPKDKLEEPLAIKNNGNATLFLQAIREEVPYPGQEEESSKNLKIKTRFLNLEGKPIDVSKLSPGTDFVMELKASYQGFETSMPYMAWRQYLPSGWEIRNKRLFGFNQSSAYQDIRDDKVFTFFTLYKDNTYTFEIPLTASYVGSYFLPGTLVEAMYDYNVLYQSKSKRVEVVQGPAL